MGLDYIVLLLSGSSYYFVALQSSQEVLRKGTGIGDSAMGHPGAEVERERSVAIADHFVGDGHRSGVGASRMDREKCPSRVLQLQLKMEEQVLELVHH